MIHGQIVYIALNKLDMFYIIFTEYIFMLP